MNSKRLTYVVPEAEIDAIGSDDIVLVSIHDEEFNLDDHAVKWEDRAGW